MNELEKVEHINTLFDLYKELLTDKQKSIMEKYYSFNLSLKEISDELNISRAAVLDAIEHATKKLEEFEKKLKLNERNQRIVKKIQDSSLSEQEKEELIDEVIKARVELERAKKGYAVKGGGQEKKFINLCFF